MKMNKLKIGAFALMALTLGFVACEDDEDLFGNSGLEAKLGEQQLLAESLVSTTFNLVDRVLRDPNFSSGDTITIDNANVARSGDTVRVLYGTGVVGPDGVTTKGTLQMILSLAYLTPSSKVDVSLINYKRDGDDVSGSLTIETTGPGTMRLTVANFGVNSEFTFSATKNIFWTAGFSTLLNMDDDEYGVLGSANLAEVGSNNALSSTISDTLSYKRACQYGMESGVISFGLSGDSATFTNGSIDFLASDNCNNLAQITLNDTNSGRQVVNPVKFGGF